MIFKTFTELVNTINSDLGDFCNQFQYKRISLNGKKKISEKNKLFVMPKGDEKWAINSGGGTEIQYHVSIKDDGTMVKYGLGFNTQYVQFANAMSMVDYVRPYMQSFLDQESVIQNELNDYSFVYGNREDIVNPKNGQFTLFGKSINCSENEEGIFIDDEVYHVMISDLKRQFDVYQTIFEQRNKIITMDSNLVEIQKILEHKKQIILQGPPGTGKTRMAKLIAQEMLKVASVDHLEDHEQFKIIQFHPSYTYEDFVRGIVAETEGEKVSYITKNKTFAEFAEIANKNFLEFSKKIKEVDKIEWIKDRFQAYIEMIGANFLNGKYYFNNSKEYASDLKIESITLYSDSFNNGTGFKYSIEDIEKFLLEFFDSKLLPLKKLNGNPEKLTNSLLSDFRKFAGDIPKNPDSESLSLEKYVLIIDEINRANLPSVLGELIYALEYRGEPVESMYDIDGDRKIIIPPNLYIIGTMNTADRSVGHIDYAIRRRFAFVDVLPTTEPIKDFALPFFKSVSELFVKNCDTIDWNNPKPERSDFLAPDFRPEDVWIGHSYFIAKDEEEFKIKLKYEIQPILKEYLKDGILLESAKDIIYGIS